MSPPTKNRNVTDLSYALIGQPNCGKTSLFNSLTGLRQKVANYPGVTIEKKWGTCYSQHGKAMQVLDLPGVHSLNPRSIDEQILQSVVLGHLPGTTIDRFICVIDASRLERSLYLLLQVLELGKPTLLVINTMHISHTRQAEHQSQILKKALGIPVVVCKGNKPEDLFSLKVAMSQPTMEPSFFKLQYPSFIEKALHLSQEVLNCSKAEALLYVWGSLNEYAVFENSKTQKLHAIRKDLDQEEPEWRKMIIQERYQYIHTLLHGLEAITLSKSHTITDAIDKVVLHPFYGWLILVTVFLGVFLSIFSLSTYPMGWIESTIDFLKSTISTVLPESQTRDLIHQGIISGVGNVCMFVPQILILFFFIGILELSGYLPRAVFLMDGIMRRVGLSGKAFIPLLSSYACAIPGILSTRTLQSSKERLITIMIAPWVGCSARLPIYLLMISVLLPSPLVSSWKKALCMLGIYTISTAMALTVAWIFRNYIIKGKSTEPILELPLYQWPSFKNIFLDIKDRLVVFIKKAGSFILAFSILFWFLSTYPKQPYLEPSLRLQQSFAGRLGKAIEPAIKPLGYDWKMGVGILSSFAARELFLGTMGIMYQVEHTAVPVSDCGCGCCGQSKIERSKFTSILLNQKHTDGSLVYTPLTCLSLIVFYMFALQCTSTLAVVRRETGSWKWPIFQFLWMTIFAYIAAYSVYQIGLKLGFL